MDPRDAALEARLQGIARLLALFKAPGFQFGSWIKGSQVAPGITTLGYYELSDAAREFVHAAAQHCWVTPGFDWGAWQATPEARRLLSDEQALAEADPEQLARLLTLCIRSDRFNEGALAAAYDAGLLTRILHRAQVLLEEVRSTGQPGEVPDEGPGPI
jgi:hypothetical protein